MHQTDRRLNWLGLRPTGDLANLTAYTSKRGKVVWFPKSPPLKPPSDAQRRQRLRFTAAAIAWQNLTQGTRNAWNNASRIGSLHVTGYNLWIYWQLRRDLPTIRTIARQTGQRLLP